MQTTHRDLCRRAAAWLLNLQWCRVAGYEIGGGGGVLDAVGVSSPVDERAGEAYRAERERVSQEWQDALERWNTNGRKGRRPGLNNRWGVEPDRVGRPRIVAVEVKRARSDLLADLRVGKMLRYESVASECYLAYASEWSPETTQEERDIVTVEELAEFGLPSHWGLLRMSIHPNQVYTGLVRRARRHRDADLSEVRLWTYRVGASLAYRSVQVSSPVSEEAEPENESPDYTEA